MQRRKDKTLEKLTTCRLEVDDVEKVFVAIQEGKKKDWQFN